ncbi:MAG: hypothetical protein NTU41_14775, partial [Chloroflexi bacterium]|nr:hypothetical protein [Chloroflexota bacterium]
MITLRPYQTAVATSVWQSIQDRLGRTFSVEIARQGGKNELSAILEVSLLTVHLEAGGTLIKASPTFKPQTIISMERLKQRLNDYGFGRAWHSEMGYIVSLGAARAVFLSADETSNVVGHTADILLEMDEAQDIDRDKYGKEFRPMGAATNCTTVLYGTTWDDTTLLDEVKQTNLELERRDGIKRHFCYDWQAVAECNPDYRSYVLAERDRLGENHPLFRTQYALLPIQGGGRLLNQAQLAQLAGSHPRCHSPRPGGTYIAGIDLAGEQTDSQQSLASGRSRDATAVTIAEVSFRRDDTSGSGEGIGDLLSLASADPLAGAGRGRALLDSRFRGNDIRRGNDTERWKDVKGGSGVGGAGGGNGVRSGSSVGGGSAVRAVSGVKGRNGGGEGHDARGGNDSEEGVLGLAPSVRVVELYAWTGRQHHELFPQMVDLLKNVWNCRR